MNYIALFRGINVGGKNCIPMKELALLFGECGCTKVRTYIQSGNVVFESRRKPQQFEEMLGLQVEERFGCRAPVVFRSEREWAAILAHHPFSGSELGEDRLHVYFLRDAPTTASAATLDLDRSPPDRFLLQGREVFLWTPNGLGRSKLTNAYFDGKLRTVSTARNWRTVKQLGTMLEI